VIHRGQRVPNLYTRPKTPSDSRAGDVYEVVYRDELGKQRQKTLNARTVQRAIAEAEEHRTKVRRGEVVAAPRLTMSEVAAEYLAMTESLVTTGERSQRTLDLYRQRYTKHVDPVLGRRRMQDIRAEHIGAIYAKQRRDGLKPWTINGTHTVISAVLTFALSRGYLATNPIFRLSKLDRPSQVTAREPRRLSEEEVRSLCANATPRYRPIIVTLAWTGTRVSEALALRWEDVDFENQEIRIRHQLDGRGEAKKPKTKAGTRSVPLLPIVAETLREHRKAQLAAGLAGPERLVFTTASGKPLNRHNVRSQGIVPAAEKAGLHAPGLTTVTTHDLRRTFISHLILGLGLDPVRVSKIAGHSNVTVTLNTYADEFDKAQHRDDLLARIERAGFGSA
jgi:integrase